MPWRRKRTTLQVKQIYWIVLQNIHKLQNKTNWPVSSVLNCRFYWPVASRCVNLGSRFRLHRVLRYPESSRLLPVLLWCEEKHRVIIPAGEIDIWAKIVLKFCMWVKGAVWEQIDGGNRCEVRHSDVTRRCKSWRSECDVLKSLSREWNDGNRRQQIHCCPSKCLMTQALWCRQRKHRKKLSLSLSFLFFFFLSLCLSPLCLPFSLPLSFSISLLSLSLSPPLYFSPLSSRTRVHAHTHTHTHIWTIILVSIDLPLHARRPEAQIRCQKTAEETHSSADFLTNPQRSWSFS